jgi:purine-binding chemotaxis protein CheW
VNIVEDFTLVNNNIEEYTENTLDNTFLTFWTDKQLFGIPITDVVQIIGIQGITPIPDFPRYAKGIINLRGSIIPVIDIRIRFAKPEIPYNERTCIIVTRIEDAYMGFIVDAVAEVTNIKEDKITAAPKVAKDTTNKYLTGIGQIKDNVLLLLDIEKILTESEFKEVMDSTEAEAEEAEETEEKIIEKAAM